jgi:large subunit ribosomal protein L18
MTKAKGPTYRVPFRRRREKKTDYEKRLALVKSEKPRMVVRKSNRYVDVSFVVFKPEGDRTLLTVTGKKLSKLYNWPSKRNVWSAYLTGLCAGKELSGKGVKEFILDVGMHTPSKGSVLFAALQGAVDAGLKTDYDAGKIPSDKLANPPENIKSSFEDVKKKILAG